MGSPNPGVGSTGAAIKLQDLRIYVSNIRLLDRDGREQALELTADGVFQGDRVALLDFENASGDCNGNSATNSIVRGRALAGEYVGPVLTT